MRKFIPSFLTLLLFFSCEKNENIDIEPIQTSQMSLSDLSASDLPYGLDKLIFENKSHSQDGFKSRTIENGDADFKSIIGVNDDKLVKHMWVNGFTSYSAPLYVALDSERVLFGSFVRFFNDDNEPVDRYHLYITTNAWFKNNHQKLDLKNYSGIKKIYDAFGAPKVITYHLDGQHVDKEMYTTSAFKSIDVSDQTKTSMKTRNSIHCEGCIKLEEVVVTAPRFEDDDGGGGTPKNENSNSNIGYWTKTGLDGNYSYDFNYYNNSGGAVSRTTNKAVTIRPVGINLNFNVRLAVEATNIDLKKLLKNPVVSVTQKEVQYLAENDFLLVQQLLFHIKRENYSPESLQFLKAAVVAKEKGGEVDFEDKIIDELTGKAKCVYDMLKNTSGGFKNMIKKFDGDFPVSHLKFEINNSLPNGNYGVTIPPEDYITTIQMRNTQLANISDLGGAVAFAHEVIHAEIFRKMLSAAKQGHLNLGLYTTQNRINYMNSLRDNFPGLYDYYWKRYRPTWNHNLMAQHYRSTIADIIEQFDNSSKNRQIYEDIAWAGLRVLEDDMNSVAWNNLSGEEQQRIIRNLTNFFHNGTSNCN